MQKGGQAQSPACQDSFPSDFSNIHGSLMAEVFLEEGLG